MSVIIKIFYIFLVLSSFQAVAQTPKIDLIATQYFADYAKRDNFEEFLNYYDDNVVLEDIVYGNHIIGKPALKQFFNWQDPKFSSLPSTENLVLSKLVVEGKEVSAQGHFNRFTYDGSTLGPWRFTIHLTFNEQGKIIHQVDWINYTPRKNFLGGKDMNQLIPTKALTK